MSEKIGWGCLSKSWMNICYLDGKNGSLIWKIKYKKSVFDMITMSIILWWIYWVKSVDDKINNFINKSYDKNSKCLI